MWFAAPSDAKMNMLCAEPPENGAPPASTELTAQAAAAPEPPPVGSEEEAKEQSLRQRGEMKRQASRWSQARAHFGERAQDDPPIEVGCSWPSILNCTHRGTSSANGTRTHTVKKTRHAP